MKVSPKLLMIAILILVPSCTSMKSEGYASAAGSNTSFNKENSHNELNFIVNSLVIPAAIISVASVALIHTLAIGSVK